ncbi:transposase [Amycolatopsis sp. NPDC049252]|uniref:transposase n=1 Tax=Amycolatopsis sp. NPDC049252 TaxID=3363933 RepID=UPI0037217E3A
MGDRRHGPSGRLIDALRQRVHAGAPWHDIPARSGSWAAAYGLLRRWLRDGTWKRILTALPVR